MSAPSTASRALVLGGSNAAIMFAVMLAKTGRKVTVGHNDGALIAHFSSGSQLNVGRMAFRVPQHLQFAHVNSVDAAKSALSDASVVFCSAPLQASSTLLKPVLTAISEMPSLAPDDLLKSFPSGGIPLSDMDGVASSGKKMSNCFPVVVSTEGAPCEPLTATGLIKRDFPEVKSVFSMAPLSFEGQFATTVAGIPESTKPINETNFKVFDVDRTSHILPSILMGASETASLKSRDAVASVLRPFQTHWIQRDGERVHFRGDDGLVDLAVAFRSAASFAAGVLSSTYGQNMIAVSGLNSNLLAAVEEVQNGLQLRLPPVLTAFWQSAVIDTTNEEYIFGRTLGSVIHAESAGEKAFKEGHKMRCEHLAATLQLLGNLQTASNKNRINFFEGLRQLLEGGLRTNVVARTLCCPVVDWEADDESFLRLQVMVSDLDNAVQTSDAAVQAAFRKYSAYRDS